MEKLIHSITIDATREKVWKTLWDDPTYRQWTSVFDVESYFEGDIQKEGNEVRFIGSNGAGMYAKVAKVIPNEFISFRHLGEIGTSGEQKPFDDTPFENYTLESKDDATVVTVNIDLPGEYKEMFDRLFPQALQKLKEIAES